MRMKSRVEKLGAIRKQVAPSFFIFADLALMERDATAPKGSASSFVPVSQCDVRPLERNSEIKARGLITPRDQNACELVASKKATDQSFRGR